MILYKPKIYKYKYFNENQQDIINIKCIANQNANMNQYVLKTIIIKKLALE